VTSELQSLFGIEGIAIFSLIVLVSIALAGFRLSAAGMNDGVARKAGAVVGGGRRPIRHRLATRLAHPAQSTAIRSRSRDVVRLAAWFLAAAPGETAQRLANQSGFDSRRIGFTGVRAAPALAPAQCAADPATSNDHSACVASGGPQRMDSETQWSRVNSIVNEGLAQARQIEELHEAAARQLDAVDYAYERMLLELREVLPGVAATRSVCRTHRDEAHAALESAAVESSSSEGGVGVAQVAVETRSSSSRTAPAAPRGKPRKPKAAESVAA